MRSNNLSATRELFHAGTRAVKDRPMTTVIQEQTIPAGVASPEKRETVLIADDHVSIRQMLAYMIPKEGPSDHGSVIIKLPNGFEDQLPAPLVTKDNVDDKSLWGNKS